MRLKRAGSKKHKKTRNVHNKSNRTMRSRSHKRSSGGGCGCESTSPISKFFIGGKVVPAMHGGSVTTNALLALPASNYYPLNDYSKDPNYLVIASNQTGNFTHSGGKRRGNSVSNSGKRKHMFYRAKTRSIKGGGYVSDATAVLMPAISNTVVGAASYGAGGAILNAPSYSPYSEVNPPPTA